MEWAKAVMFQRTVLTYRSALQLWLPVLSVYLFVRLVLAAIILPVIGVLLTFVLSFSNQSAVTDQDIARFLLTPAGALGGLALLSMLIAAAVTDIAVMTAVLRAGTRRPMQALSSALRFGVSAFPRLIRFSLRFVLRVMTIVLPFLVPPAIAALFLLRAFDINYYLSVRPPEFLWVIGISGISLLAMAIVLLRKLTGWAVSLHICLFERRSVPEAFAQSEATMQGFRQNLIRQLLGWFAIRLVCASVLTSLIGFLLAEAPTLFGDNLTGFYAMTIVVVLLWAAGNALLAAVSNGALAFLLNDQFSPRASSAPQSEDDQPQMQTSGAVAVAVVFVAALFSLFASSNLSNRFGGLGDVAVIGHRGAAASRPENTIAAVVKAVEDKADWVEIDVQETSDGHVIVVHDSDFMKAAGNPAKVWDVTLDEASEIDIGSWFDPQYADERPPLLSDVLKAVKDRSKLLIELKYYGHDEDLENRVISLVEAEGMADQVATMSLKYPAVQKMKSLRPEWRAGVLAATALGNLAGLEGDFVAVSAGSLSGRLILHADAADKDVYVWTINDAPLMSRVISMGVDGIITDDPALANEVLGFYQTLSTPERLMLRLADRIGFAFDLSPDDSEI